jgi:hypothetical protein
MLPQRFLTTIAALALTATNLAGAPAPAGKPWPRHTIDDSSRGADGTRLADVNGDGLVDIATGWEEGGVIRAYLHPGHGKVRDAWPAVTVGQVRSPEDAVFADVDGDGATDVVSCCEGQTRSVFIHWAPKEKGKYLDPDAWTTEAFPALKGQQRWMFALPMQVDGTHGIDLVIGAKGGGAQIGWLRSPETPRDLAAWTWHPMRAAGWIMSLIAADMDGDGDSDVAATDRKGRRRGVLWLENPGPGPAQTKPWAEHGIGGREAEVMFMDLTVSEGKVTAHVAVRPDELLTFDGQRKGDKNWAVSRIPMPQGTGTAKAVALADVDGDGRSDLVVTCEHARGKIGVFWLQERSPSDWQAHNISGTKGTKYDLVVPIDLDGDGDLDVLTCEERENLGVIWYENPNRARATNE